MRRHSWLSKLGLVVGALAAAWFSARELRDSINKRRAFAVVYDLGGTAASIPCWPFGSEIRIAFDGLQLSSDDVRRLTTINPLTDRHAVEIAIKDSGLSSREVADVRKLLPNCRVIRIVDGVTTQD